MSCHGCFDKFGFLKKEYGCPKCGFSYCKKCLRFQIVDPKTSKQLQVCSKCHHAMSTTKEPLAVINALQRLESMDDPAKPPIVVYKQTSVQNRREKFRELRQGLSEEDQHILERLESLKRDDSTGETKESGNRRSSEKIEEEIAERLAKLKGEEYKPGAKSQTAADMMRNYKPETEADVLAKFAAEAEMDSRYNAGVTSDIEERLARLRGANSSETNPPSTSSGARMEQDEDDLSEEDQIKLIMQKLQEELALEKKLGATGLGSDMDVDVTGQQENVTVIDSDEDDIDVDELCGICSEKRATLICEECDDDIFCKACFQELHRDLGEIHAPKAFKKK